MSSSNRVGLKLIKESAYNTTPAGNLQEIKYVSEGLSGSPETTQSQGIVTDRQPQGQVLTGLSAGGEVNFELARRADIDALLEGAMYSTWVPALAVAGLELEINISTKKIIRSSGSFLTDGFNPGDFVILSGFANAENNVKVKIVDVTALELDYIGPSTMVDESTDADNDEVITRPSYLDIGTTKNSYTISKEFEDLTNKSISYAGALVDSLAININIKEIVSMAVGFVTAGYNFPTTPLSDGRTVDSAGGATPLNAQADAGKVFIDGQVAPFCIQTLGINLGNNHTSQDCLGEVAPVGYSEGGATVEVNMSTYLVDDNFSLLGKKLTQEAFGVLFYAENADGGYAFDLPAIQVAGEDPSSGGANQEVSQELSGTAKKGPNGESALRIYRLD